MIDRHDRIAGVLLAQACGDALGSHYEFGTPSRRCAQMLRGRSGHGPGEFTDDTQQAVCVAQARSEPLAVAERLLEWYRSHPRHIGIQTRAIMSRCSTPSGLQAASRAYASRQEARPKPAGWDPGAGNGSLMRTGPVCLPHLGDRERIARVARDVSDLTHADAYSGDACVLWSLSIDAAISAAEPANAQSLISGALEYLPQERRAFWQRLVAGAPSARPARLGANGSAVGCLTAALHAAANATGLEDGLQRAVSYGHDTDTVAAVVGGLLGAIYGASAVPDEWREAVHGWPGMKAPDLEDLALQAAGV